MIRSFFEVKRIFGKLKTLLLEETIDGHDHELFFALRKLNSFGLNDKIKKPLKAPTLFILSYIMTNLTKSRIIESRSDKLLLEVKNIFMQINVTQDDLALKFALDEIQTKYFTESRKLILNKSERERMLISQNYICPICLNTIKGIGEMHIDHIKPLALGGSDTIDNFQGTHSLCNLKKGVK